MAMSRRNFVIMDDFANQNAINPLQRKKVITSASKVKLLLDSGAIATLPIRERLPADRRGPFDWGLKATWIIYITFGTLALLALIGLIILAVSLNQTVFNVSSTQNQTLKFFGIVLCSTVFTSLSIMLFMFGYEHAKEAGWLTKNKNDPNEETEKPEPKVAAVYTVEQPVKQLTATRIITPMITTPMVPTFIARSPTKTVVVN